jgi:anti-sigma factor RsiW
MTAVSERPTERDLHAMIDERLDRRRARELEGWLADEALRDERFAAWKRGLDGLRAAYDPILDETPPLYLSMAARASVAQAERLAQAQAQAPAAAPPAKVRRDGAVREVVIAVGSFLIGAAAALLLTSAAKHFVDPRHPSILAAGRDTLTTIWSLLARPF